MSLRHWAGVRYSHSSTSQASCYARLHCVNSMCSSVSKAPSKVSTVTPPQVFQRRRYTSDRTPVGVTIRMYLRSVSSEPSSPDTWKRNSSSTLLFPVPVSPLMHSIGPWLTGKHHSVPPSMAAARRGERQVQHKRILGKGIDPKKARQHLCIENNVTKREVLIPVPANQWHTRSSSDQKIGCQQQARREPFLLRRHQGHLVFG